MHRHPARRIGLVLLLAAVCAPAFAATAGSSAGSTEANAGNVIDADGGIIKPTVADGKPNGFRERDGRPAAAGNTVETSGGEAEANPLPRASSARWHRFLPGMFR